MKNVEIPKWLEGLPLAPEFRPTDSEFADPIAYISKIEKEASAFGICKVIPPLPRPSRKYVLQNLNKSLSKWQELGSDVNFAREGFGGSVDGGESRAVFTTRQQELGCEMGKKAKGSAGQKQVWQSGEVYKLEEFEAKSKNFSKSQLGTVKEPSPLVVESMFWKATGEKPIYIEYANDVPGSGFGEPVGLLHYFHRGRRRRRKRNSYDRGNLGNSDNRNDQVDDVNSSRAGKDSESQNNRNLSKETASSSLLSSSEIEGTAGWKLSNSPWNLQVIARSPGSLTRFMPDDIPGVTSPMVYIGMLFSWFAWHVEDHELHSLNFLHMGSPKTWYAVPGDYAFNFEEVIRCHAYGGNTDRLVTLSRLGEKTTVLSPEVIVTAGIPCCRLVQNPGEFVVTFPRAYHIGFSHGFSCGEAANFGTSKWLTVAKEAAIRRAAMNYLPMLSHQQLLYLLTMSFISRIPRSLLPGVRSSRLKDRQKEERELSVKRAFIQDIVHENNLLTVLFQKNSSYRAVLWDVDLLPSPNKDSELCKDVNAATSTSTEKDCHKNDDSVGNASQLSEYISAVDFDLHGDDLAYVFQIDSGSLPCVACGILGFPFMAVVQPSEAALNNLLIEDHLTSAGDAINKDKSTNLPPMEQSAVHKYETVSSKSEIGRGWSISDVFLRPRIFCLEHAIETEELLSKKGGANVLVICHSDFQKIKAHAGIVAEETATPFYDNEIPFGNASLEDLKLIDIAIDRDEQVDSAEDWTSLLNINLQHFVKVKRSFPSKKVQYLSALGRLFSDASPISSASSVKWTSRKLRSKRHLKYVLQDKSSGSTEIMQNDLKIEVEHETTKKHAEIIQYSRKRYKSRAPTIEDGKAQKTNVPLNESMEKGEIVNSCHVSQENEFKVTDECLEKKDSDCSENLAGSLSGENKQGPATDSEAVSSNTKSINESTEGMQIDRGGNGSVPKENDLGTKPEPDVKIGNKRKRDVSPQIDDHQSNLGGFIKSPCEGLRPRTQKDAPGPVEEKSAQNKPIKPSIHSASRKIKKESQKGHHKCDLDSCTMSFQTKAELVLHKGNRCPIQGCRKKFNSHKYALLHQRVHDDDRPLKCSWKGCTMSFKWAWARTEHLRVHTGERPYTCKVEGCGLTFRFVSDFSRHRRKTGHSVETN